MNVYEKYEVRPLSSKLLKLRGISPRTITEHYKLYEGYVNKVNETREKLQAVDMTKGNATYSEIRALKRGEGFALNGAKLHELYFEQLGGKGGSPSGTLMKAIQTQYGSYDAFLREFRGSGLSGRGWAILAHDWVRNELFVYITDDQQDGHVIQSTPILPMDVYEHAYYIDYGTNRSEYITAFLENLDWSIVNIRYQTSVKRTSPRFRISFS